MSNFTAVIEMTLGVLYGQITEIIKEGIVVAGRNGYHGEWASVEGTLIRFTLSNVMVSVRMDSDPALIERDFHRAMSGYIDNNVGPYPHPVLTDKEVESDARIEAKNERGRQEQTAEYTVRAAAYVATREAKLATTPPMEIVDTIAWQSYKDNNQGGYGSVMSDYAERWARLMQAELAVGNKLEDIAETTSVEADIDGIPSFMFGAAVQTLVSTWTYGDQLREWFSKKYGKFEEPDGLVIPPLSPLG